MHRKSAHQRTPASVRAGLARFLYLGVLAAAPPCLFGIGYFYGGQPSHEHNLVVSSAHASETPLHADRNRAAKKLWVCPMHAHILQDHPGTCPICGMDLVEADGASAAADTNVEVDTATQQRIGVKLAPATEKVLSRTLHTYGTIAIDDASNVNVGPKTEGWIRKLHVTSVGQPVRAGQLLYEIYSPELVQRQREYVELLQRRDRLLENMTELSGQNAQMAASYARERLRLREKFLNADVSPQTLDQLEKTRRPLDNLPVYAPASGFVTGIGARAGSYVTPMANLLSLANLSSAWINVALYPDQLEWAHDGDEASIRLPGSDQIVARARLRFLDPRVDGTTRTVQARLVIHHPPPSLRPGAFVDVVIAADPHPALTLPRSAVLRTGKGSHVMLARGDGRFLPVPVETGIESGDEVEITDGLQEGALVAVNGQFLLDAAASLSDAAQRMQGGH